MRNLIFVLVVFFGTAFSLQAQINMDVEGDGKISGGLTLGNTSLTTNGTLRYNGADIEARLGGLWTSLTAGGGSSLWSTNSTGINYNSGNVGIGPIGADPTHRLTVYNDTGFSAIYAKNTGTGFGIRGLAKYIGVYAQLDDAGGDGGYALYADATGATGSGDSYGVYAGVQGSTGTGTHYGLYASANKPSAGRAYGVYSASDMKTTTRMFVNTTTAIEDANPDREVLVEGEARIIGNSNSTNVVYAEYTGMQSDIGAVYGENDDTDYYGYGVHGKGGYTGVFGEVSPTGSEAYRGVVGQVFGGSGENIGVFGSASGTGRNYAIFADGDIKVNSQLFIGTSTTDEDNASTYELLVKGQAIVEELVIELSGDWPDYVFENEYDLKPLTEVQSFIDENGHLPNVPSAEVLEAGDGIAIGEMQRIMMEKIEELTLYTIDQEKRIKELVKEVKELKKK